MILLATVQPIVYSFVNSTSVGRSDSLSFSVVFSFYLLKSCLQNS